MMTHARSKESLDQLLSLLMGKTVAAYLYQEQASQLIHDGHNLLISAPTGSGKTWSVLLPYLCSVRDGKPLFDRVIYALPMRTLATNLWESTWKACKRAGFPVTTKAEDETGKLRITIQTGERKEDPFFRGNIIFTTIDQLLSSYLFIPVSLPAKLANINAGALIGSMIVFDEVHLLEPARSMATMLDLGERFAGLTQLVLMTATLSGGAMEMLAADLKAKVVAVAKEDLVQMPSQHNKQRTWRWVPKPIDAEAVIDNHHGCRSIAICNSVSRAQELFREVRQLITVRGLKTELCLLHSRFLCQDRQRAESILAARFGPKADKSDVILVATQVVEAGIDISADVLHTELCPANALLQRAGRCARYEGERGIGTVYVYQLDVNDRGELRLGPYRESAALVLATRLAITKESWDGCIVGNDAEVALVKEVHEEHETKILREVRLNSPTKAGEVAEAIDTGDRAKIRDLIRDVDSLGVTVSHNPDEIRLEDGPEVVSIPRVILWAFKETFKENPNVWVAKEPKETQNAGELDSIGGSTFIWELVRSVDELRRAPWLVALNPAVASYDRELGLLLGSAGEPVPLIYQKREAFGDSRMRCETFREHVAKTLTEAETLLNRWQVGTRKLEERLKLPHGAIRKITLSTCALHDTGKLQISWQEGIKKWQKRKNPCASPLVSGRPLARSDYVGSEDWREARSAEYRRPPHAAEGAFAVANLLSDLFSAIPLSEELADGCAVAARSAIARHHTARAISLASFTLIKTAENEIEECVRLAGHLPMDISIIQEPTALEQTEFSDSLVKATRPRDGRSVLLYCFLSRCLRLADQASAASLGGE